MNTTAASWVASCAGSWAGSWARVSSACARPTTHDHRHDSASLRTIEPEYFSKCSVTFDPMIACCPEVIPLTILYQRPLSGLLVSKPCPPCFKVLRDAQVQPRNLGQKKAISTEIAFHTSVCSAFYWPTCPRMRACLITPLDRLKQTGSALAAADAHGDNTIFFVATLQLTQNRTRLT